MPCTLIAGLFQVLFQHLRNLMEGVADGGHVAYGVEETVVVDEVFVTD